MVVLGHGDCACERASIPALRVRPCLAGSQYRPQPWRSGAPRRVLGELYHLQAVIRSSEVEALSCQRRQGNRGECVVTDYMGELRGQDEVPLRWCVFARIPGHRCRDVSQFSADSERAHRLRCSLRSCAQPAGVSVELGHDCRTSERTVAAVPGAQVGRQVLGTFQFGHGERATACRVTCCSDQLQERFQFGEQGGPGRGHRACED